MGRGTSTICRTFSKSERALVKHISDKTTYLRFLGIFVVLAVFAESLFSCFSDVGWPKDPRLAGSSAEFSLGQAVFQRKTAHRSTARTLAAGLAAIDRYFLWVAWGKQESIDGSFPLPTTRRIGLVVPPLDPILFGLGGGWYQRRSVLVGTRDYRQFAQWVEEGKRRPVISKTVAFEVVPEAYATPRKGRSKGKVIIHIGNEKEEML